MKENNFLAKGKKLLSVAILLMTLLGLNQGYSQCTAPPTNAVNWVSNPLVGGAITMNSIDVGGDRNLGANISGTALFINTTNSFSIPATSATINTNIAYNSLSGGQQQVYSHGRVDPFASVTGLKANTTYYFKLVGYYLCNGTYYYEQTGKNTSATTCGTDNLVTNPVFSNVAAASMALSSFTAPAGSTPTGYVVKMNTTNSFTPLTVGTAVPSGNTLYSGGEQVVYGGTSNTPNIAIIGLTGNTDYYFKIYAYFETCSQRQYQQTGYGFSKYTGNNKILPQVSISNLGARINAPAITLSPSSTSTAPFTYQIISETGTSGTRPTISGNTMSIPSNGGFFTIEATQAPNATHLGTTATFTVNIASNGPPVITFANTTGTVTPNVLYGDFVSASTMTLTGQAINSTSNGFINYTIEGDAHGHTITGGTGAQVLNYSYQPSTDAGGSIVIKGYQEASGVNPAHEFYFGVTYDGNGIVATDTPAPITPLSFVGNKVVPGEVINLRAKEPMINPILGSAITYDYTIEGANPSGSTITNGILTVRGQHGISSAQLTIRVTASSAGNVLYLPTTTKDFTIDVFTGFNLAQTITFPELSTANLGDVINLGGYSSSGLALTYTSSNTSVATISGNTLTVVGKGTTNITASQAGNVSYLAATDVVRPLTAIGTAQDITFNELSDAHIGVPYTLNATASSNLAVSFSSSDPTIASVSGNTVTPLKLGSVTITASQTGNDTYEPALNKTQLLTNITPPIITTNTVALAPSSIICGTSASVTVNNSQNQAVKYYLRDDANNGIVSATPVTGDGGTITLVDENTVNNRTYNVLATYSNLDQVNAFQLDGQDGRLVIPGAISSEIVNNITVETKAFIPTDHSTKSGAMLIGQSHGSNIANIYISIAAGKISASFRAADLTYYSTVAVDYTPDTWFHVAATYDKENLILYIDGVAVSTVVVTADLPTLTHDWWIGPRTLLPTTSAHYYGGKLADTRIWNVTRSAAQIIANKDKPITSASNLLLSYQYGDGVGSSTITNLAGNAAYNGTLINLPTDATTWLPNTGSVELDNLTAALTITSLPIDNTITFTNTLGYNPIVTVNGTTAGLIYSLRNGTTVIGSPITSTGGNIVFPEHYITGDVTYNILVSSGNSNCDIQLTNTTIITENRPAIITQITPSIPGDNILCGGSAPVNLSSSQTGIKYYLRLDSSTDVNSFIPDPIVGTPILGTGSSISFPSITYNTPGTYNYNVYATHLDTDILNTFQFNGSGYLTIPNTINSEITNAITIETQAYIPASESSKIWTALVTQKIAASATIKFTIFLYEGKLRVGYYNGANGGWHISNGDLTYTADEWFHVAGTFDGTTIKVYLNGVHQPALDTTPTAGSFPVSGTEPWYVGSRWDMESENAYKFGGQLSNTRIWKVARSETDINANKDKGILSDTDLVVNFQYSSATGNIVRNILGDGTRDGTFTGNLANPWSALSGKQLDGLATTPVGFPSNNVVILTQPDGNTASVSVENSSNGLNYYLRTGTTVIGTAVVGNGGTITFPNHNFTGEEVIYNVLAGDGSCQTQLKTTRTANFSYDDVTVNHSASSILCGESVTVSLGNSQTGLNYYLRDDATKAIIGSPIAGTSSGLSFPSETLMATRTHSVFATLNATSTPFNRIQMDDTNHGYITIPGSFTSEINNSITIETMAFIPASHLDTNTGTGKLTPLVSQAFGSNEIKFAVYIQFGKLFAGFYDPTTGWEDVQDIDFSADQWFHLAVTYNGVDMKFYIDGVNVKENLNINKNLPSANNLEWRIGRRWDNSATETRWFYGGQLANTRIWNVVRSPTEISNNKDKSFITDSNLVLNYQYLDGAGSNTVTNLAGNTAYNGSFSGGLATTTATWPVTPDGQEMTTKPIVTVNSIQPTVVLTQPTGQTAVITVQNSLTGVTYTLREGTTVIGTPISGDGTNISFPVDAITANKTYNVLATSAISLCGSQQSTDIAATYNTNPSLALKVFLQGPYDTNTSLMKDDLRSGGYIPITSPYGDGATLSNSIINVTGNDAIVDWVYLQLRDKNEFATVRAGKPALLQRDGDVVHVDGVSPISFSVSHDNYDITISHRNHIAIATVSALNFIATTTTVDLTQSTNVRGGVSALEEVSNGIYGMVAADVDGNQQVQTADYNTVLSTLGQSGYLAADLNMDGQVQTSEITTILVQLIGRGIQF